MRRSFMQGLLAAALVFGLAPTIASAEDVPTAGEATSTSTSSSSGDDVSAVRQPHALMDASPQERHHMLSFFAQVPFYYGFGFGVGARYTLPIVPNGFIPSLNDSVELEFGADLSYQYFGFSNFIGIGVPAEARWTFHITDKFDAYGKAGVGWLFGINPAGGPLLGGFYPVVDAGILYRLNDTLSLRAEAGWQGLKGGIGIDL